MFQKFAATTSGRITLLLAVLMLTTLVPYLFPGTYAVNLSYVVHFSNRAGLLIFLALAAAYALVTGGYLGVADRQDDHKLSWKHLLVAICMVTFLIFIQRLGGPLPGLGSERPYNYDRVLMLASGFRPYVRFEYIYGPLNLYTPVFLSSLLHISLFKGYTLFWGLEWCCGTAMIWYAIRHLAETMPWRRFFFWTYMATSIVGIRNEGLAYSPVRTIGAAFLLIVAHRLYERFQLSWTTVSAWLALLFFAFAVSPEQGFGVAVGLVAWAALLFFVQPEGGNRSAAAVFAGVAILLCVTLFRSPYCYSLRELSHGAYSFPLTVSLPLFLILATYISAACAGYTALIQRHFTAQAFPLLFAGIAMLPAALGRCDSGHIQFASPALFLGFSAVQSHTAIRRWWTYTFLLLFTLPQAFAMLRQLGPQVAFMQHRLVNHSTSAVASAETTQPDPAGLSLFQSPCREIYRVINVIPPLQDKPISACVDTGYYFGLTDVFTASAVDRKLAELAQRPRKPLLMVATPLDQQFLPPETDPKLLRIVQGALYLPHAKYPPFTYNAIPDYVRRNYIPDATPIGQYRVWRPKQP